MADSEYAAAMARFLGLEVCGLFADERVVEVYVNRDLVVRTDGALGRQETCLVLTEEAVSPNCAVQVAFAPTDLATAERLSSLSGRQTIEFEQVSRSSGGLGSGRGGTSRQTVLQGRPLLDASEFRRLGREQAVVFMPGLPPLVVKKRPYFTDATLQGFTEEEPWHEPPGEGETAASGARSAAGRASFDTEEASRERGWERNREGEEKERSHGGF